jgi:hypothetical protein
MSDETVFVERREICDLYPSFVNSDGTIEYNLLTLQIIRDCCLLNHLDNVNLNNNTAQIGGTLKEIRDLLIEIRDNTNRIP